MIEIPNSKDGIGVLVLVLHAYTHTSKNVEGLCEAVCKDWKQAKCICPNLPLSRWSVAAPDDIVIKLLSCIDEEVKKAESTENPITNIVLVGHSIGALLARKLYVVACGEIATAPFSPQIRKSSAQSTEGLLLPRKWAVNVSRLILLAGMNRGWSITHHLSLSKAPLWIMGAAISHVRQIVTGKTMVIMTIRKGATFITELRIQWIRMRQMHKRNGDGAPGGATTIQLLGSIDDMVSPSDNIDLVSGGDFIYLDVPYSSHGKIIDVNEIEFGDERERLFRLALKGSAEELERESIVPSDERFASPDETVRKMVFVIHGIRDVGYWTHKIARRVMQRTTEPLNTWATETSSYGYFPMLPFILPWYRRKRVEWLMDQYTEALARYPNALISYVGHSNGTYLLAKALETYPCCSFNNVVFAGSVVQTTYDWSRFTTYEPPRVNAVLNCMATKDWVVAFFPRFFEVIPIQDLGSAGHDGFTITKSNENVFQVGFVAGSHSAAIKEPLWDVIADFIITGESPAQLNDSEHLRQRRNSVVQSLGMFPPLIWAVIGLIVWLIWKGIDYLVHMLSTDPVSGAFTSGFALATYFLVLWLVLIRL